MFAVEAKIYGVLYKQSILHGPSMFAVEAKIYGVLYKQFILHGPSMFAVEAKIYGVLYNSPALSLLMKHLVIGKRLETGFHWSPRGSLVSIDQHFVATRVVHLPKSTETSLITESDQRGPNHQLLQLCTGRVGPGCAGRA